MITKYLLIWNIFWICCTAFFLLPSTSGQVPDDQAERELYINEILDSLDYIPLEVRAEKDSQGPYWIIKQVRYDPLIDDIREPILNYVQGVYRAIQDLGIPELNERAAWKLCLLFDVRNEVLTPDDLELFDSSTEPLWLQVPEDVPETLTENEPWNLLENVPGNLPDNVPENAHKNLPVSVPANVPGNVRGNIPGNLPDNVLDNVPENVPGNLPKIDLGNIPGNLPDEVSGDVNSANTVETVIIFTNQAVPTGVRVTSVPPAGTMLVGTAKQGDRETSMRFSFVLLLCLVIAALCTFLCFGCYFLFRDWGKGSNGYQPVKVEEGEIELSEKGETKRVDNSEAISITEVPSDARSNPKGSPEHHKLFEVPVPLKVDSSESSVESWLYENEASPEPVESEQSKSLDPVEDPHQTIPKQLFYSQHNPQHHHHQPSKEMETKQIRNDEDKSLKGNVREETTMKGNEDHRRKEKAEKIKTHRNFFLKTLTRGLNSAKVKKKNKVEARGGLKDSETLNRSFENPKWHRKNYKPK